MNVAAYEGPQPRRRWSTVVTPLLLAFGVFLAGVGWFVGVALLWQSPLWTRREKLIGTFVPPLGLGSAILFNFWVTAGVGILITLLLLIAALAVPVWLARQAGRRQ